MVGGEEVYFRLMFYLLLFVFLVSCNSNVEEDQQIVTEKVEVSDFILEVTTTTIIQIGQILKVKGTLTYVGEETVNLFHGSPVIRFSFTGSILIL